MEPSAFKIVRFVVGENTLHALLSGHPERRRACREFEWGLHESDGDLLVSPPLTPDRAAELRAVFHGAEGVTETDLSGEYTLGSTNAPESYDGFGTLTVRTEGDARVVAIRQNHLNWQYPHPAQSSRHLRAA